MKVVVGEAGEISRKVGSMSEDVKCLVDVEGIDPSDGKLHSHVGKLIFLKV